MKVSTLCLGSCTGCHISLLGLGEDLLPILSTAELIYSPVLVDVKKPGPTDLAIVEGAPRNEEDVERLGKLREKAKTVLALGSCASMGGITGLGNVASREEIKAEAYEEPDKDTPELRKRVYPIDHYVEVDWYLTGCPPPKKIIGEALTALLAGKEPPHYELPVCAECERRAELHIYEDLVRTIEKTPDAEECLLSQGYICLGSVTRGGCDANCTTAGVPCLGCRGPVDRVITEPGHGIFRDLVRRRAHLLGLDEKEVEDEVYDLVHTLYTFTLSSQVMRLKQSERVADEIYRVHLEPGEAI
ncbi:MAG: F420-nonreducing hydrogenase [Candidatus Coatesbacteria bacterium]|nr:MAG: F420-nonreducing hydrogenase [Candidatus Coatesbacteria bacterium]